MIWNLTRKGKSLPKEAFPLLLSFTLLFHIVQAIPQPGGWLDTERTCPECPVQLEYSGREGSGHGGPWWLHCHRRWHCASKCFQLSAFTRSHSWNPPWKFRGFCGSEGLLGLCIFCFLTSFIALRDFLRRLFCPSSLVWLRPAGMGELTRRCASFLFLTPFQKYIWVL